MMIGMIFDWIRKKENFFGDIWMRTQRYSSNFPTLCNVFLCLIGVVDDFFDMATFADRCFQIDMSSSAKFENTEEGKARRLILYTLTSLKSVSSRNSLVVNGFARQFQGHGELWAFSKASKSFDVFVDFLLPPFLNFVDDFIFVLHNRKANSTFVAM